MDMASPNFLGIAAQVYAGTKLSAYSELIRKVRGSVPVINETGWLDGEGSWHGWNESGEDSARNGRGNGRAAALLKNYRIVQYYSLFDPKRKP